MTPNVIRAKIKRLEARKPILSFWGDRHPEKYKELAKRNVAIVESQIQELRELLGCFERMTFEEACSIQHSIATGDNFRDHGIENVMKKVSEAISPWTTEMLADEAARRLRLKIKELKNEESRNTQGEITKED